MRDPHLAAILARERRKRPRRLTGVDVVVLCSGTVAALLAALAHAWWAMWWAMGVNVGVLGVWAGFYLARRRHG